MEKFLTKQEQLKKALEKVQVKINWMHTEQEKNFYEPYDNLSEESRNFWRKTISSWNWNDWTDLKDRLENRLKDNYAEYCDWHFQEFGWVSI